MTELNHNFDCKHCGMWLCRGGCQVERTPQQREREAEEERRLIAQSHRLILDEEAKRLKAISDAEEFFRIHDENGNPLKVDLTS